MTHPASLPRAHRRNFNPHEREARDALRSICAALEGHFNPHEREARDASKDIV